MSADFEGTAGPDTKVGPYETMQGFAGDDTLGSSAPIVSIYGGDDDDTIGHTYSGTDGTAYLYGEGGDDILLAGSNNDKCYGGSGKDVIYAGTGENISWGGGGRDYFGFLEPPDDKLDRIMDFKVKKDSLFFDALVYEIGIQGQGLSKAHFRAGKSAKDDDDNFGYNKKTGIVWFDPDGIGGQAQVDIVKVDKNLAFTHQNIQL